jgi:hypothetical protein
MILLFEPKLLFDSRYQAGAEFLTVDRENRIPTVQGDLEV